MNNFRELNENEMLDINGGITWEIVLGVVSLAVTGYALVREMVRDQGRADAYEDVSSAAGCYANETVL